MQTLPDFAHGLLTHETLIIDEVRMTVVAGFDHEQISKKCVPSSLYYDADLSDYNVLLPELINVGQMWKSRDLLLTFYWKPIMSQPVKITRAHSVH